MRTVVWSKTTAQGIETLLSQGLPKCGFRVIDEKRLKLERTVDDYLTRHPKNGSKTPGEPSLRYEVSDTPFAVIYTFDDETLAIHFIIHKHADTRSLDPADVEW